MLFHLIIVVCVAMAAVGVALLTCKLLRIKAPKFLAPTVAALAIIGFTVWYRYEWAERIIANLPPDSQVLVEYPYEGFLEPWSRIWPRPDRLLVLDGGATLRNPEHPDMLIVKLQLLEQDARAVEMLQFVDCTSRRRAPVGADPGLPSEGAWQPMGDLPGLYEAVCR